MPSRLARLERFSTKWKPVRRQKAQQNKSLELGPIATRSGTALSTAVALLGLGGCNILNHGFLGAAGPVAEETRGLFFVVCLILLFVLAPVLILTPIFAWHYRLSNTKAAFRPNWGFSWPLEGLIWIPPTIIVIILAVYLWIDTHKLDPYKPLPSAHAATEVQAVALDWKWLFIYPDEGIASVNQLVFPADRPIHLRLTSGTVMQIFFVPQLGGQINVMAGMVTQHNLAAHAPGRFWGENMQFNGMGFQNQKFDVQAKTVDDYRTWVMQARANGKTLDMDSYRPLSAHQTQPQPIQFGSVAPNLFEAILKESASGMSDSGTHAEHGHHK